MTYDPIAKRAESYVAFTGSDEYTQLGWDVTDGDNEGPAMRAYEHAWRAATEAALLEAAELVTSLRIQSDLNPGQTYPASPIEVAAELKRRADAAAAEREAID